MAVYNYFDIDNHKDFITIENFKQAMERTGKKMEDEVVKKMLTEIGADNRVSREKFLELMLNQEEGSPVNMKANGMKDGCLF